MTVQQIIDRVRRQLRENAAAPFYTEQELYDATKETVRDIAQRSRTLLKIQTIAAVSGQSDYRLPDDFLSMEYIEYNDGRFYPLTRVDLRSISALNYRNATGKPWGWDFAPRARVLRASGAATGGSNTTLDDTLGAFTSLTGERVIVAGDRAVNVTDGSAAKVSTIAATQLVLVGLTPAVPGLSGGNDDTFAATDAYRVESYYFVGQGIRIHPAANTTDTDGSETIQMAYFSGHYDLDTALTDQSLIVGADPLTLELELDPEFDTAIYRGAMAELVELRYGISDRRVLDLRAVFNSEYARALPLAHARSEAVIQSWRGQPGLRVQPLPRTNADGSIPTGLESGGSLF